MSSPNIFTWIFGNSVFVMLAFAYSAWIWYGALGPETYNLGFAVFTLIVFALAVGQQKQIHEYHAYVDRVRHHQAQNGYSPPPSSFSDAMQGIGTAAISTVWAAVALFYWVAPELKDALPGMGEDAQRTQSLLLGWGVAAAVLIGLLAQAGRLWARTSRETKILMLIFWGAMGLNCLRFYEPELYANLLPTAAQTLMDHSAFFAWGIAGVSVLIVWQGIAGIRRMLSRTRKAPKPKPQAPASVLVQGQGGVVGARGMLDDLPDHAKDALNKRPKR
jgi:hypothetical protein